MPVNTNTHTVKIMFNLSDYLEEKKRSINAALDRRLPADTERPVALHKAMRYSVFAGGKRIRPILCLAAAEAVGQTSETAMIAASAVEILHTYTLIHDDLPSMDNDAMRRGLPTLHVVAGEANAILAGDALLTMAFEWLAEISAPPPYPPNQLSLELARGAGSRGVVGGQVEDIAAEGKKVDPKTVDYIHRHKTAALLRASIRMGAIAGGAGARELDALTAYGDAIGLAFQIADDILNETSTAAALGKAVGSDRKRRKMTYIAAHGLPSAQARMKKLAQEALTALDVLPQPQEPLAALARFITERTK